MHSNQMQEVSEASAGDIVAMFGVDCASGTTFTNGKVKYSLTSMHVPDPVVSLALIPKDRNHSGFGKALGRFTKEDPTFRVHTDDESNQTIISGMGALPPQRSNPHPSASASASASAPASASASAPASPSPSPFIRRATP